MIEIELHRWQKKGGDADDKMAAGKDWRQPGKTGDGGKDHKTKIKKEDKMNPDTKAKTIGMILLAVVLVAVPVSMAYAEVAGDLPEGEGEAYPQMPSPPSLPPPPYLCPEEIPEPTTPEIGPPPASPTIVPPPAE